MAASDDLKRTSAADADTLAVLVTGFNDWKDLGEPPNVWRCRDNPSCRLLVGAATSDKPETFAGPLVAQLRGREFAGSKVQWTFATLPVTWEVAATSTDYAAYDVVVHLGLGVYDRTDTVFVEDGAFNRRKGTDAAGRKLEAAIDATLPQDVLTPAPQAGITASVRAVDGRQFGAYRVEVKAAREANTYLCNETHFSALQAVAASRRDQGRLERAYFVHIPFAQDEDYGVLADGVAGVVAALVGAGAARP
ncbi:MAG: hypothetical protein JKY37_32555 [Nannocystaceae bacterium]|nr:hypothetical protein [Nannocystaceae bacterium]